MIKALAIDISSMEKSQPAPAPKVISTSTRINNLVEHVSDLGIDDTLRSNIFTELHSLNLKKPGRGVKTKWLSPSDESYNYGKVLNSPMPIKNYPHICKLAELVNKHPSTTGDMDCCLVTRYPSNKATLSLHSDNEKLILQSRSICTVSFGAPRELEFVINGKKLGDGQPDLSPDLVLAATDRTMNVLKPGAQSVMRHAVGPGTSGPDSSQCEVRFSLSFRKIVTAVKDVVPVKQEDGNNNSIQPNTDVEQKAKKSITLIAGDSFAARLKADLLGKGKRR